MKKLNKIEAIAILNEYIETSLPGSKWYQLIRPFIKAIVFYGSTARGLNKPESDLDILIFVPLEIEEKYTKGEYFYKYNGREINIVLRSIEKMRKLSQENDREVFKDCEILYESDIEIRELINKILTISK